MQIVCSNNNGTKYLQVQESYYDSSSGAGRQRKRVVRNLGPLKRFDDGKPDFLYRLRSSFRNGNPIIPELSDLVSPSARKIRLEIDPSELTDCVCNPKNIGYFLLDALYDNLGVYDVLNRYKSDSKLEYDLNGIARLLVFGRLLWPDSKLGTFEKRDRYLFGVAQSANEREIYRALDCLDQCADAIQTRMNTKIRASSIGRNTEVCFYDVTNFWFEIGQNDPDECDEKGSIIRPGLRKKGVSKENRGEPIVQMGLFIDDNGIPIAYRLFPGNNTDQTTLRPAAEKSINKMNFKKVIIVADGGLNNGPNIAHILSNGNGYIVSKSVKKSDKQVKAWILDETGYQWNDAKTFKVKSQIRSRKIKAQDGSFRDITEKLVCFWSKKHFERERHENEKFIEYLESVAAFPDKLKDKPRKIEQFLKKTEIDRTSGEVVKTRTSLSLDIDKIRDYLNLMGYYTIITSELDKPDDEIINKYHGLSRIEDSFRITKSDLEARPVYVRTPEHINAHFLICFIVLTMIRVIQHRVLSYLGKDTHYKNGWESGLSACRIKDALEAFQADALPGGYFRLTLPNSDMRLILASIGVDPDLRLPSVMMLRGLKKSFASMLL
jgi:transposase